jgi:hypothetical protein
MSQQPTNQPAPEQPANKTSTGMQENVEGLLCYLGSWITGLIFFIIKKIARLSVSMRYSPLRFQWF